MLHDGVTVRMLREQRPTREAVDVLTAKSEPKRRMTVKLARELCAGILRDELEHSRVRNARQVAALLRRSVKRAEAVGIPAEALQRYLGRVAKMLGTMQRVLLAEEQWVRKRAKHQA